MLWFSPIFLECSSKCTCAITIVLLRLDLQNNFLSSEVFSLLFNYSIFFSYFLHCKTSFRPVDGMWGEWGTWSDCTATCGGGTRDRTRECTGPEHGGKECEGETSERSTCNEKVSCPAGVLIDIIFKYEDL